MIQVIKVVVGILVALLIKEGLKFVFPYSANVDVDPTNLDLFLDFVRYFLIANMGIFRLNVRQ